MNRKRRGEIPDETGLGLVFINPVIWKEAQMKELKITKKWKISKTIISTSKIKILALVEMPKTEKAHLMDRLQKQYRDIIIEKAEKEL